MYLRAAKTEAADAGIETDGMADSVSKLREDILSLTGGKVDLMLDENSFKSTYKIFKELSQVWDDLTDINRANILEKIGGKRKRIAPISGDRYSKPCELLKTLTPVRQLAAKPLRRKVQRLSREGVHCKRSGSARGLCIQPVIQSELYGDIEQPLVGGNVVATRCELEF